MKSVFERYKINLVHTGVYTPSLAEYVSRPCRMELLKFLVAVLDEERKRELKLARENGDRIHGGQNKSPLTIVAEKIEVSKLTVNGWFENKKRHPSNENTRKIIDLALDYDSDLVIELLEQDLFAHQYALGTVRSACEYPPQLAEHGGIYTKRGQQYEQ